MAEKVLVLTCASITVIEKVMNKINPSAEITCLVQETSIQKISNQFKNVKVISLGETYFSYEAFCKNVKFTDKFDTVYIPSSAVGFHGFEEVFKITDEVNCKKVILFNCEGEETIEYRNAAGKLKEELYHLFIKIYLAVVTAWYKCIGQKMKI